MSRVRSSRLFSKLHTPYTSLDRYNLVDTIFAVETEKGIRIKDCDELSIRHRNYE